MINLSLSPQIRLTFLNTQKTVLNPQLVSRLYGNLSAGTFTMLWVGHAPVFSQFSGADPGFLLGGGAPLRNDVTDR